MSAWESHIALTVTPARKPDISSGTVTNNIISLGCLATIAVELHYSHSVCCCAQPTLLCSSWRNLYAIYFWLLKRVWNNQGEEEIRTVECLSHCGVFASVASWHKVWSCTLRRHLRNLRCWPRWDGSASWVAHRARAPVSLSPTPKLILQAPLDGHALRNAHEQRRKAPNMHADNHQMTPNTCCHI